MRTARSDYLQVYNAEDEDWLQMGTKKVFIQSVV